MPAEVAQQQNDLGQLYPMVEKAGEELRGTRVKQEGKVMLGDAHRLVQAKERT